MAKQVDVILLKEQPKLGHKNQVVSVPLGHATNFLIPQHIAIPATKEALKKLEEEKKHLSEEHLSYIEGQKPFAEKLKTSVIKIPVHAQESGSLYGSVSAHDIAKAINLTFGSNITEHMVTIDKPLKKTGQHTVTVTFGPELYISTTVDLVMERF